MIELLDGPRKEQSELMHLNILSGMYTTNDCDDFHAVFFAKMQAISLFWFFLLILNHVVRIPWHASFFCQEEGIRVGRCGDDRIRQHNLRGNGCAERRSVGGWVSPLNGFQSSWSRRDGEKNLYFCKDNTYFTKIINIGNARNAIKKFTRTLEIWLTWFITSVLHL